MSFYTYNFLVLAAACGFLFFRQRRKHAESAAGILSDKENNAGDIPSAEEKAASSKFTRLYLVVYALTMGSDWLQGPHIYALYKDQLGFPEETVAMFFTAGFLSGAVSSYFVGNLADRLGRKLMCLIFCITYSLSCLSTLFPVALYLYIGRLLGGLSTSILYSAFESWMVTEFHSRGLDKTGSLSHLFGILTSANSIVAIVAGVGSEWVVAHTGTRVSPFMMSAGLLGVAFVAIWFTWNENYGERSGDSLSRSTTKSALKTILTDTRILSLGLASTFFEGSMYLFVFFWTPSLSNLTTSLHLPYGLIFANFMASMMLGSNLFTILTSPTYSYSSSKITVFVFLTAALSLLTPVLIQNEYIVFYAFCVFEACVGMYFPAMGTLKGRIVQDGNRAGVYGILRIPLNCFVVASLSAVGFVGRDEIFLGCAGLLVVGGGFLGWFVE